MLGSYDAENDTASSRDVISPHPHAQRLMMPGQHRAGEVVEAPGADLIPTRVKADSFWGF